MSNVKNTNQFFTDVYHKVLKFSYAPYNWSLFGDENDQSDTAWLVWLMSELPLKILLSPVLLPATLVTCALAFLTAIVVALTHLVTLMGAAIIDVATDDSPEISFKS
ncbi:MAG: hypothetical protein H0U57_07895 [Tatlockia sp.]|nr:hypothetical protein [Tatlockia sp.]